MTPERWKQIDELAQSALERGVSERAAFLDQGCAGDDLLRHEVESQIAYQQEASRFLEEPAFKHAAELIADSQTESESMEGQTISHYSILRKLGAGGMGEVYLAQDATLQRKVAIKFLSQNSCAVDDARKRLLREARSAAALDHPHICAVYEVGEDAGHHFIVMQYVEGETLATLIERQAIESREALEIAEQIADALAEAHSHKIIHRDVKPQNVMLTASGQVKVLDFGLARMVREGALIDSIGESESLQSVPGLVIGTVNYMSPEQVRGEELDARSDIFSFGVVLYEMLSGRHPYQAESAGATMSAILTADPAPLARYASDTPDELQRIVGKALVKDKEGRYQGIKDLLIDLQELKQALKFEAELDRAVEPGVRDRSTTPELAESGGRAESATALIEAVRTDESFTTPTTSSTKVVIGEIKRHKLGVSLTLAALMIAAVGGFFYFNRKPVLTEHDTILLVDFDNKTGDEVFDGTLKQGLAVQLEQSPFLNLFPDTRVRDTLKLMKRSPDERVTTETGLEICQRQGLKALITGSIARLGSHYVVTLAALNSTNGAVVAREQIEAESREQVLKALSQAASRLREKLGESLNSIQKFDAPLEATTSSLEALKAYKLGQEQYGKANFSEAIAYYNRAVGIDANFALAYHALAFSYGNTGRSGLAEQSAGNGYALRDRVSEREKLTILDTYHLFVTGDVVKQIEAAELRKGLYPDDPSVFNHLSRAYYGIGLFEKAVAHAEEALRLNPHSMLPYLHLGSALIGLNRFAEARDIFELAVQLRLDYPSSHRYLYQIAFASGDTAAMQRQLDWVLGKHNEDVALDWQADAAAYSGRWRRALDLSRRSIDLAMRGDAKQAASDLTIRGDAKQAVAEYMAEAAFRGAVLGQCNQTKAAVAQALAPQGNRSRTLRAALALSLCGEKDRPQGLLDELVKRYPTNTKINSMWAPIIHATIELRRDNAAHAIELLQPASRYEAGAEFWPQYLRGLAYLKLKRGAEAAAEFQKILDHRGEDLLSPLYPLAHLGSARSLALSGDTVKSRKAYEDFFELWKDADADLAVLIEAKKEYARLNR